MAKSASKTSAVGLSARNKKETNLTAGERDLDMKADNHASKTHVRFGEEMDDNDVRKSYYKNN
jgi:hypothetical protein